VLLRRSSTGDWSQKTISSVAVGQTRGILALDPADDRLFVVQTTSTNGISLLQGSTAAHSAIYSRVTTMSNPKFVTGGKGTALIKTSVDLHLNNATTTKQVINRTTGLLVEASDNPPSVPPGDGTGFYLHGLIADPLATPPVT
jgi:hypothetical protein